MSGPQEIENRLPTSSYPRIEKAFRFGERFWNQREDLQVAFPEILSPEYWYWLMWHGADDYIEAKEILYPAPDGFLMDRVIGESNAKAFRRGGLVDWRRMEMYLRRAGFDFGGNVLDFGCGTGRILRFFGLYSGSSSFYGADVDQEAVAWCMENIDFATFTELSHDPPTPYASEMFDAVYSFSVFTHLPEKKHRSWLEELYRITRPNAILVLTVAGQNIIDLALSGKRDLYKISTAELRARSKEIEREGFAFFPYGRISRVQSENQNFFDEWDLEQYGNAFILESYIRSAWTDLFDVVAHNAAPDGWQDFIVLKRK